MKKDVNVLIVDVDLHGNELCDCNASPIKPSVDELSFKACFRTQIIDPFKYQQVGEVTVINYVIEDEFELISDQDFIFLDDTLKSGDNLIKYFEYSNSYTMKFQRYYYINYNFRCKQELPNIDGYYNFQFKTMLSDGITVTDSCSVEVN
jgi:hypothetical protein